MPNCIKCKANHPLYKCEEFKKLTTSQRQNFVQGKQLCKNCLSTQHKTHSCPSKIHCYKCQHRHHTLLHTDQIVLDKTRSTNNIVSSKQQEDTQYKSHNFHLQNSSSSQNTQTPQSGDLTKQTESLPNPDSTHTFLTHNPKKALLSTALVNISNKEKTHSFRALIDSGSQISFISERAAKRLKLKQTPTNTEVMGLGMTQTATITAQASFTLSSIHTSYRTQMSAFVLANIADSIPPTQIDASNWHHISNIKLADPNFSTPGPIDLLLGADIYADIIENGVIKGNQKCPTAQNTLLGWILMGNTSTSTTSPRTFTIQVNENIKLEEMLKKFWEQEEEHSTKPLSAEDKRCEAIFKTTHARLENGTYQVKLPFKESNEPCLGQSRNMALRQFFQLEKRFRANPELKEQYSTCIKEYLTLEHMKEVTPEQLRAEREHNSTKHYYLPHHAVIKESSTTTKLRVVFNASAKTSNGKSLNEQLLVGPTIQPTLWTTLLRWRKHKYAFTADVEKMYRMISMHPEHQRYQRLLWRETENEPIKDLQLTTVTFGFASAPYLAIRTLQQLAMDERQKYPLAAQSILQDFYVDDLLSGAHDTNTALQLQEELLALLSKGGFNLRKWAANSQSLLEKIPMEHREVKTALELSENDSVKTLGIKWHPATDKFTFTINFKPTKAKYTKRAVLSETASLFDPLGWIAPCVVTAKIFMQKLWLAGIGWDEVLPEHLEKEWRIFREDLSELGRIQIPRWIHYSPTNTHHELHGFCDASDRAYAAVIYAKTIDKDGKTNISLLTAKTRVAPTKAVSLPKLELCGALTLARLIKQVKQDMNLIHCPTYAWTDSEITLAWIHGQPTKWKTYVANRVAEIQDSIPPSAWQHIRSKENPADAASRGMSASNLLQHKLWWQGPSWLLSNTWKNEKTDSYETIEEAKKLKTFTTTIKEQPWLTKYSSFQKLLRITAYCLRFIQHCKTKEKITTFNYITPTELERAELKIIHLIQQSTFHQEYHDLHHKRQISKKSRIRCLRPFLADDQTIRVGGRLEHSSLTYNQKHPIILPNKHHVTTLLINDIHKSTMHGGTQLVLNTLRNKYWLLNARNTVRFQLRKCIQCFRANPKPSTQIMGNLPTARINPSLPFEHTGVDYAGPISIKTSKLRNAKITKGYFCIFVCMATKAIHIEIVTELTTHAFLAALNRFISRRGPCTHIYSDCGTNFVGAAKELSDNFQKIMQSMPQEQANDTKFANIKWHFNPPAAPHFGGLWEANVKLIKTHLKRTLQGANLTFEELYTTTCQIEACINSRPLSPLSNDPFDYNVLTPGHFLTGRSLLAVPDTVTSTNVTPTRRWAYVQTLVHNFWKQWSQKYLQELQQRPKWQEEQTNLKENDMVIIQENTLPKLKWPLGRITKIFPGKDNQVRVAEIKTKTNTIIRPITKIYKLPTH